MAQDYSTKGGLASAYTTGNGNKALSFVYSVKEMVEGLLVVRAQKQVSWIWR